MTWTQNVVLLTGRAYLAVLNYAETGIKDSASHRLIFVLVRLVGNDVNDTALDDFIGVCDSELDTDDNVAHYCISLYSL